MQTKHANRSIGWKLLWSERLAPNSVSGHKNVKGGIRSRNRPSHVPKLFSTVRWFEEFTACNQKGRSTISTTLACSLRFWNRIRELVQLISHSHMQWAGESVRKPTQDSNNLFLELSRHKHFLTLLRAPRQRLSSSNASTRRSWWWAAQAFARGCGSSFSCYS